MNEFGTYLTGPQEDTKGCSLKRFIEIFGSGRAQAEEWKPLPGSGERDNEIKSSK